MKQGLTEMVFILDRSGSMSGLEKDTIGGFNSTIEKQKQEPGQIPERPTQRRSFRRHLPAAP